MSFLLDWVLATAALLQPSSANAAWCRSNINNTPTCYNGDVGIWSAWRSAWTTMCNVKIEWKGIPTEV